MTLEFDTSSSDELFTITLSDDELNDDTVDLIIFLDYCQSSLDVFQRTAAFEFSSSFFKVRGLDSDNGSVLINGIEMNKQYNGRPQWSDWGGLNDVLRNQELSSGLQPSSYNFGGILGTNNMNVRASQYQKWWSSHLFIIKQKLYQSIIGQLCNGFNERWLVYGFYVGKTLGK